MGALSEVHSLGIRLIHSEKAKGRSATCCKPVPNSPEPIFDIIGLLSKGPGVRLWPDPPP